MKNVQYTDFCINNHIQHAKTNNIFSCNNDKTLADRGLNILLRRPPSFPENRTTEFLLLDTSGTKL